MIMTSDLALFDATYLEIDPNLQAQAWQQNDGPSRWQAYLNQLCLDTVIPWLREDHDLQAIPALKPPSLQSIWAVVTGDTDSGRGTKDSPDSHGND